jgi:predicted DNA-binding ribbon-helix-helix protein
MRRSHKSRSIVIAGRNTSVSLEDGFWSGLKDIAGGRNITRTDLVRAIDAQRQHVNLSSALRLFVLEHYATKARRPRPGQSRLPVDIGG